MAGSGRWSGGARAGTASLAGRCRTARANRPGRPSDDSRQADAGTSGGEPGEDLRGSCATTMTTPRIIPQERSPRAELIAISEKDIADVALFIAAQSSRTAETVEAHLRWFLLENPARRQEDSLGFGLRSAGELVGCILCSPQAFCFEN